MDLVEVMRTTFACREFTADEVTDDALYRILENARFAPSGGNRQGWRVVVVKDAERRDLLRRLIEPVFRRYLAQVRAGENPFNTIDESSVDEEAVESQKLPSGFVAGLVNAPALLLVFVDLKVVAAMDKDLDRIGVVPGASIYPFVWNILLAARNEGLGGTLTTFASAGESEIQQAFGVPSHMAVCAMVPLGRPVKQLTKLKRKPVEEFATVDAFDGRPLSGPDIS